ncbi:hypothetical protein ABW20_dc0104019 [Dactylellina cionopaga]|nr:hypothetical protein ABW20_dc0104019 [Dactylellina cionopaga]
MQWKISIVGAILALIPLIAGHSMIIDAVGNANDKVRGCALGVDELPADKSKYMGRNWRDTIIFAKPWKPDFECKACPRAPTNECAECLCRDATCPQMFIPGCTLCPKFDLNCPKCRTYTPNNCGRRLRVNESSFYTKDYDGPFSHPVPGGPYVTYIDGQSAINAPTWIEAMAKKNEIPYVTEGGVLTMSVYQQNADGAGPYSCRISYGASPDEWESTALEITTNVPGVGGISTNHGVQFPLVVRMPNKLECTGSYTGAKNVCLIQCSNTARNGPFGGCIPIQVVPGPKPPPPVVQEPPKPKPVSPAEVKKLADGEELTADQIKELAGYYKRKFKFRFFRG